MEKIHKEVVQALRLLNPESQSAVSGLEIIWGDETPIDEAIIDSKILEIREDYKALEYARNRKAEYPSIAELTVALYDTDDKSAIEAKRAAVKLKYPKP